MSGTVDHAVGTDPARSIAEDAPVVSLRAATLAYGSRVLWEGLDLDIAAGEFLAVLGPNGSGKTSFLKVLLGQTPLSAGTVSIDGRPVRRGSPAIGYVPQQKSFAADTPLRARDLVGLGLDGHKWGIRLKGREHSRRVDHLLAEVGATAYAKTPVGLLSGGEQQRLRVAQALATDPDVLLCDEPLLSLDLKHQRAVSELIAGQTTGRHAAVVFVTHEINPVVDHVDRVLYLAGGQFRLGTPEAVMTTEVLSDLYGTRVEVLRSNGRIVVVGVPDAHAGGHAGEGQQ